jgi:uncharacterized protein YaeQ
MSEWPCDMSTDNQAIALFRYNTAPDATSYQASTVYGAQLLNIQVDAGAVAKQKAALASVAGKEQELQALIEEARVFIHAFCLGQNA